MHRELKNKEYYNGHIMNDSFTEWLKTCPKEYTHQMNQVTKDRGTYTFFLEDVDDDISFMESEDSEGNAISVDVSKTIEANKKLLEHPFYK